MMSLLLLLFFAEVQKELLWADLLHIDVVGKSFDCTKKRNHLPPLPNILFSL
jgi:hypothetical protein